MYYSIIDEQLKTCSLEACDETEMTHIDIPSSAVIDNDNYTVTRIGAGAFYKMTSMKSVNIPNTINSIGTSAFADSQALESIIIPNSVTELGSYIFRGCSSLNSVTLSNNISSINGVTFYGCTNLKSIVLPPSVSQIHGGTFHNSGLEKIFMGPNVIYIGENVFTGTNLTDIYITAQSAPGTKTNQSPFPEYAATLHLQGEAAKTSYAAAPNWSNFQKIDILKYIPEDIKISKHSISGAPKYATSELSDNPYSTETHIYGQPGDTVRRTAELTREDNQPVEIPNVFWRSDDPSKVYVENDGTINIKEYPEWGKPVNLTCESLYANAPTRNVVVDNYTMTGVDEIVDEENDNGNDSDAPARIYTIGGLPAGNSLYELTPGVYVVIQGQKKVKINIR